MLEFQIFLERNLNEDRAQQLVLQNQLFFVAFLLGLEIWEYL